MVNDIKDLSYQTPLKELKDFQYLNKDKEKKEESEILWWVFLSISCILTVVYGIVVYLEYIDNPKTFKNKFNNEERLKFHGLSHENIKEMKHLAIKIKDQLAVPTESHIAKDLKRR